MKAQPLSKRYSSVSYFNFLCFLFIANLIPLNIAVAEEAHSGNISQDTTWDSTDTHLIQSDIIVEAGVTLTISSGTQLSFNNSSSITTSGGTLLVQGTQSQPVILKSSDTDASAGAWNGITTTGGSVTINHANISDFKTPIIYC